MLSDALVLAILSTVGLVMTYKKLPRKVRRFLQKYALFTDFLTFVLTYLTLGSTLTALTAGAMVAIFTSMLLHVAANPDDFLYLYDLRDKLKKAIGDIKAELLTFGQAYKQGQMEKSDESVA